VGSVAPRRQSGRLTAITPRTGQAGPKRAREISDKLQGLFTSFGDTLKALQLKAGMTLAQRSLASKVNVKAIRDYEDGETGPAPRSVHGWPWRCG
jgi:hypothetical protein